LNFFAKNKPSLIAYTKKYFWLSFAYRQKGIVITGPSPLLAPVGSGFLLFPEYLIDHEKLAKKKFSSKWILVDLLFWGT